MMRRLWVSLVTVLLLLVLALPAFADGENDAVLAPTVTYAGGAVTLSWLPPAQPAGTIRGYFVYHGTASGSYDPKPYVTQGHTFFDAAVKLGQTYYFTVVPYYGDGKVGAKSSELSIAVPDQSDATTQAPPITHSIRLQLDNNVATVDGRVKTLDVAPQLIGGRTMVPLRFFGESVGATITWNGADRSVTYELGSLKLILGVDRLDATLNGNPLTLDVAPTMVGGRTFVPLRFAGEKLGAKVQFDGTTHTVLVLFTSPDAGLLQTGDRAINHKDVDGAITIYTQVLSANPNSDLALIKRAYAYRLKGNWGAALADYNQALTIHPNYDVAYNARGLVYYVQQDYDRAVADFSQAITISPDYAAAYANRALVYFNQKNYSSAIADDSQAITLQPFASSYYDGRAAAYRLSGDLDHARADYQQEIQLNANSPWGYYGLGLVAGMQGKNDDAIAQYNIAIAKAPNMMLAVYARAVAYAQKGDTADAIVDGKAVMAATPVNSPLWTQAQQLLQKLGVTP